MKVYVTQVHASHKPSDEDPLVTRLDVCVAHAMWSNGAVTYGEGPSMLSAVTDALHHSPPPSPHRKAS